MSGEDADVVVVGAGIGGTLFALTAARQGWRVTLLEREPQAMPTPRPEILWGPTLRLLDAQGVGAQVREACVALSALGVMEAGTGRRLLGLDRRVFEDAEAAPHASDPNASRRILLEAARATGLVRVEPGVRATGLRRSGARVMGVDAERRGERLTFGAPFIVGDDGARSVIRDATGIAMDASPFPVEFLLAGAARPTHWAEGEARAFLDPDGFRGDVAALLVMPVSASRVGVVAFTRRGITDAHEAGEGPESAGALTRLLPEGVSVPPFPGGFVRALRGVGHAEAYSAPGVALLGDAAHPVSPVGGQGANMSIADAEALARHVLSRTRPGQAPNPDGLLAYENERRPANHHSLAFSRRAAPVVRSLWRAPVSARLLPPALRWLDGAPQRKRDMAYAASHAFLSEAQR